MSRHREDEHPFHPRQWMTAYVIFVLRSLLTRTPMPADTTVADWMGVRRETIVRGRRQPGFFPWLQAQLQAPLRGEFLDAETVAATEPAVLAADIERTRGLCTQHRVRLRRTRIKLGRQWLTVWPAPPPAAPQRTGRPIATRPRQARPTRSAAA